MKLPSLPATLLITLILFSPTYFNSRDSTIPVKNQISGLFTVNKSEVPADIDVESAQNLLRQVVVVKANNLRLAKTDNLKTALVDRLIRLSREFEKFSNKNAIVTPEKPKEFSKFSSLTIDYLGTIYAIHFIENGVYPDSVAAEDLKLAAIPVDIQKPFEIIQNLSQRDNKDYIKEFIFKETQVVDKNAN
jgi:hypothetical protein